MAEGFELGRNAVRALANSQQRTRSQPHNIPEVPRPHGARQIHKQTGLAVALDEIEKRKNIISTEAGFVSNGKVRVIFLQANGSIQDSFEIVLAFNMLDRTVKAGEIVNVILDWYTGKWMIVNGLGVASRLYLKVLSSFGTGDGTFPARLITYFGGIDPRGSTWSANGDDVVINPPVDGGAHFFSGVSGVYGFAEYHEPDKFSSGSPAGYWCYQLQCAVA